MYGDLDERETLLDELRITAKPLIDTCTPDVAQHIDAAVQEAVTAWNDTRENLLELRTKYQRAVQLWQQYREASAAVKVWADEQMGTIGALQPMEAAKQVKVSDLNLVIFYYLFIQNQYVGSVCVFDTRKVKFLSSQQLVTYILIKWVKYLIVLTPDHELKIFYFIFFL